MKRSRVRMLTALGVGLALLVAAGCGSTGSSAQSSPGGQTSSASSAQQPSSTAGPASSSSSEAGQSSPGSTAGSTQQSDSGTSTTTVSAAVPDRIRTAGVINVAVTLTYPPEEFYEEDGKTPTGFTVDLGNAIGKELGLRMNWIDTAFSGVIPGLLAGRFDIAIDSMSITPERLKQFNFVSYFNTGAVITVKGGNPSQVESIKDLCGLKVGATTGSLNGDNLKAFSDENCGSKPVQLVFFQSSADAQQAFQSGRTAAMFGDFTPAVYQAQQSNGQSKIVGPVYFPTPYGIAVPADEVQFAQAITDALNNIIKSGEYGTILKKWNVGEGAISAAELHKVTG